MPPGVRKIKGELVVATKHGIKFRGKRETWLSQDYTEVERSDGRPLFAPGPVTIFIPTRIAARKGLI